MTDNPLSPTSFHAFSSLNRPQSTRPSSGSSTPLRDKHRSLNIVSPGPRPLQLASGSLLSSNSSSPSPSPLRSSSGVNTPGHASEGADPTSPVQPLSPLSPVSTDRFKRREGNRRQSSISYFSSNRSNGRDNEPLRSPLSVTGGLGRSNSLGMNGRKPPRSPVTKGERSSIGSVFSNGSAVGSKGAKERPPLTLVEKHAELLHFIAQKESKCLELRSQLAMHETELLQLKRKWERIVNRGFIPPAYDTTSGASHPGSNVLKSSPTSPSSSSTPPFVTSNSSNHLYPSMNLPAANGQATGSAVVLENIKEGVQGMSRFLAAGLESITHVATPSTEANSSSRGARENVPLPLQLGSAGRASGHGQKESQSSCSTVTTTETAFTSAASSARSSMTSTSAASQGDGHETSTPEGGASGYTSSVSAPTSTAASISAGEDEDSEFGDFEGGSNGGDALTSEQDPVQVCMTRDIEVTQTMALNSDFQRNKGCRRSWREDSEEQETTTEKSSDFDWDDVWTTTTVATDTSAEASAPVAKTIFSGNPTSVSDASATNPKSASTCPAPLIEKIRRPSLAEKSNSLPGVSSIPGLASITALPGPPSSWVGTVGKKWGEIQKSTAFTKNQKRASVLLSDVSQSIASVLAPSTPSSSNVAPAMSSSPLSPSIFSVISPTSSQPSKGAAQPVSLLDDDDDGEDTVRLGSPVLLPDSQRSQARAVSPTTTLKANGHALHSGLSSRSGTARPTSIVESNPSNDAEDEEWNW